MNDSATLRAVFWAILGLLVASVALVIAAMWLAALRPISALALGVAKVGSGDLDHRVATTSKSEIGRLSRAFDEMTESLNTITVSRDSLEREVARREEAERAQAAALEDLRRSNQDLEQFAYIASHDLQEPLRMVTSYVELLAHRYKGQLDAKADKYIHFAVDGATRMQGLIDDLLLYSRAGTRGKDPVGTDSERLPTGIANLPAAIAESHADAARTTFRRSVPMRRS